jgi:hypothetical protein
MKLFVFACFLFPGLAATLEAGKVQSSEITTAEAPGFNRGTHEFEGLVSYFKSIDTVIPGPIGRPRLETGFATVRYGWMLNNQRSGFFFR